MMRSAPIGESSPLWCDLCQKGVLALHTISNMFRRDDLQVVRYLILTTRYIKSFNACFRNASYSS